MRLPTRARPKLAAGPIRRWVVGRPLLAAGPELTPQSPYAALSYKLGVAFRASVVIVVMMAVVSAACWAVLMTTILAAPSIDGKTMVTQRATWVEGKAPTGAVAVALEQPVERDMFSRIRMLFGDNAGASVVTIVGIPGHRVSATVDHNILVDGKPTGFTARLPFPAHTLTTTYLTVCVLGPCGTPGDPLEVPVDQVLGKALGSPTFTGWEPAPAGTTAGSTSRD